MIKLENIEKIYDGGVCALKDVSLHISRGDIFGVIGLSGAGKSTLVRCINLLEIPTGGRVMFDGVDMMSLDAKKLRKKRQQIGMIFQGFNLLMQKTALENVMFPLILQGVKKSEAQKRGRQLLYLVELADKENAYPSKLSGGQKQRVAIARALAGDPKVLLCDEATSALDPTTTKGVLQLLKKINKELGITIVIITHEMKVIEQICNRVAILDKAGVAEEGPVEQIFKSPHSKIAKKLIFPDSTAQKFVGGSLIRVVFDGESAGRSVIGEMVLSCGKAVNILAANTKTLDGKAYGQMLLQLPEDGAAAAKMQSFLSSQKIEFIQEEADQNGTDFN